MPIGDPIYDGSAQPGDHADDHPDQRASRREPFVVPPIFDPINPTTAQCLAIGNGLVLAQERHNFGNGKDTQPHNHQLEAIRQIGEIIARHPQFAVKRPLANCADQEAQPSRDNPLDRNAAGKDADH